MWRKQINKWESSPILYSVDD